MSKSMSQQTISIIEEDLAITLPDDSVPVLWFQAFYDTAEEQQVFGRIKHECRYRSPLAMLRGTSTGSCNIQ